MGYFYVSGIRYYFGELDFLRVKIEGRGWESLGFSFWGILIFNVNRRGRFCKFVKLITCYIRIVKGRECFKKDFYCLMLLRGYERG